MPDFKKNPNLGDFQKYVFDLEKERGFDNQTILQTCLQLGEEIGELFKSIRKKEDMKIDKNSKVSSIDEEIVDVFIFLCSIANKYNIDLEQAFRDKEERNKKRIWKK